MLQHSYVVDLILPWLLSAGAAGLLLHRTLRSAGKRLMDLAIGIGFLGAYAALAGGLPFLDDLPNGEIGESALLALAAALLLALLGPGARLQHWIALAFTVVLALWLVGGWQFVFTTGTDMIEAVAGAGLGILLVVRLQRLSESGAGALVVLALLSAGAAGVAWFAHARFMSELFLAFAAAQAGYLVWAWPPARWPLGGAALIIVTALAMALSIGLWRNAPAAPWALPILLAGLWADRIAMDLPLLDTLYRRKPWRPVAQILAAGLPVLLAIGAEALIGRWIPA